ncbi:MAG: DNA-3-methyladenine glycosylase [Bacilli bacterium]
MVSKRLKKEFYQQSALIVAPSLLGKYLVRKINNKEIRCKIVETECYIGENDTASHARMGKTKRNYLMYEEGKVTYIYLCYGLYYLFNVVTGKKDYPEAVLIRKVESYAGPGILTKALNITKELNGIDLTKSKEIWIEDSNEKVLYDTSARVGISYADEPYKSIKWRFILKK